MTDPLKTAIAAAQAAGTVLLEHLHRPLHIREKGDRANLVTSADGASEALLVEMLGRDFPQAAILGEEGGERAGSSGERWIVDPLDGTTNFAHGYPLFCISIAYEREGQVQAGVIYAPLMNECFTARLGQGACLNGRPIHVSAIERIADAMLCTGFKPSDYEVNARHFARASHHVQAVRRDGAAALDLAYTAMGRFDGFWEFGLSPWDMAAGALIVAEAGGTVSAIDGAPFAHTGPSVLASNGHIHRQVRKLFADL